MAIRGLGMGRDLNLLARFALAGILEAPERHIAELLRSSQTIEAKTRQSLADALEGKSDTGSLVIKNQKSGQILRRFQRLRKRIELGRDARALQSDKTYSDAITKIADAVGKSEKSIEGYVTLSAKCDRWIEQQRALGHNHSDLALECAFVYMQVGSNDPDNPIKPSIETFADIIRELEMCVGERSLDLTTL